MAGSAIVTIATTLLLAAGAAAAPLGNIPRLTPTPPVPLAAAPHHRRPRKPHASPSRAAKVSSRARARLPFTGLDAGEELAVAGALLAGGVAIAAATRRRRPF